MPPLLMDGTFTVPYITYDAYGRITGRTKRTITLPAAPSSTTTATKATTTPNMITAFMEAMGGSGASGSGCSVSGYKVTIPSGGTWRYLWLGYSSGACGTIAGGQTLSANNDNRGLIAVRIS